MNAAPPWSTITSVPKPGERRRKGDGAAVHRVNRRAFAAPRSRCHFGRSTCRTGRRAPCRTRDDRARRPASRGRHGTAESAEPARRDRELRPCGDRALQPGLRLLQLGHVLRREVAPPIEVVDQPGCGPRPRRRAPSRAAAASCCEAATAARLRSRSASAAVRPRAVRRCASSRTRSSSATAATPRAHAPERAHVVRRTAAAAT